MLFKKTRKLFLPSTSYPGGTTTAASSLWVMLILFCCLAGWHFLKRTTWWTLGTWGLSSARRSCSRPNWTPWPRWTTWGSRSWWCSSWSSTKTTCSEDWAALIPPFEWRTIIYSANEKLKPPWFWWRFRKKNVCIQVELENGFFFFSFCAWLFRLELVLCRHRLALGFGSPPRPLSLFVEITSSSFFFYWLRSF